ncbi:MAG: HAMP domain-containing histidine kinase [Ruminococcus sp.]|nr:HAMP domain-containing histidine kinase [Ruminococcus sp.]
MKNSVITKYFGICFAVIVSSIICIGSVLLIISLQFYKAEKKETLIVAADTAVAATEFYYSSGNYADNAEDISTIYDGEYHPEAPYKVCLVGAYGDVLATTDKSIPEGRKISGSTIRGITREGEFAITDLDGFFSEGKITYTRAIAVGEEMRYIITYETASDYYDYIKTSTMSLLAIISVTAFASAIILYFVMRNMMKPVIEITKAAERFGKGDFSQKISVNETNEFASLAASMNNMSRSLSVIEESRKSFVANVSHELKTPMTSIGGFIDGILDGTIPEDQHRKYLTIVSDEVHRLSRLVRAMLNVSKYESGEISMKSEVIDITALTIKTVFLFEKRINDMRVDVIGLDSDPCYVVADSDLAQQIIYNLVENAIKFVNIGGYLQFGFETVDDETHIAIRNSGTGLTEEEIPRIFDRFYKTDESHGKDRTGVGLGLAIVRSIINLHNGKILVRSKPGEYTEFEFTLPAPSEEE